MSLNPSNLTFRIQSVSLSFNRPLVQSLWSSLDNWNSAHAVLAEQSLHWCFVKSTASDVECLQTVLESALRHRLHDVFKRRRGRLEVRFSFWTITSTIKTQELGVVFVCSCEVKSNWATDVTIPDHETFWGGRSFDDLLQVRSS